MKNKHTIQDTPTGWESYGHSGINSYTYTQISQGYSSLSSTWHKLWFKTSRICSWSWTNTMQNLCCKCTRVCIHMHTIFGMFIFIFVQAEGQCVWP